MLPSRGWTFVPVALVAPAVAVAQQPQSPDQQADAALVAGQAALKANDPNTAAAKFNEILQKWGNTRAAIGAKYGLAGMQLVADQPDLVKAAELLKAPAEDGGFVDRGAAMYQLAVCQRLLGMAELAKGGVNPADAKKNADAKFGEATRWFYAARVWYAEKKQDDWSARCVADHAEVELRMGRTREARGTAEAFTKEPLSKSVHKPLGSYLFGLACFLEKDHPAAARALNQTEVFKHPVYGGHARYLTARIHHLQDEKAEASVHYDAVLADYEKAKLAAVEAIKDPAKFKGQPFEFARLKALATGPTPEYVSGAAFHTAGLKYEGGKFGEAMEKFAAFAKANEKDPLAADALLRVGLCQVQLKQFDDAVKSLAGMAEKQPRLADQCWFWLGKAQFGAALGLDEKTPPDEKARRTKEALDLIRKGAEKAKELAGQNDADAKTRRYEMFFELGDSLATAKQHKEAAQVYEGLWNENNQLPALRREEVLQRLVVAVGAGGDAQRSDDRANEFRRTFPQSTITGAVAFRQAENSYARALDVAKLNDRNRAEELKQKWTEAAGLFKDVATKFPEFDRANHARLGAGICLSQLGDLDAAAKQLEAIPGPDRAGELTMAAYLLGDILLRQTPLKVGDDALEENKAREKLTAAAGLFDSFASANLTAPETPAAWLKFGYCQKRLASTLADVNERNQTYQKAREAFERIVKDYGKDPLVGTAKLELAKVKAAQGDRGGAMNDLRSVFTDQNTKNDRSAPLAPLHLATLLREENKPADAAKVLAEARKQYEGVLAGDKDRAEWVQLLKYHQAVALLESGSPTDGKKLFEEVVAAVRDKPVGCEAALRSGHCRLAEARKQVNDGLQARGAAGNDPNKKNAAEQVIVQGRNGIFEAGETWQRRADELKQALPADLSRGRMLYDAAWAFRELAAEEVQQAWEQARKDAQAKLPPGSPPANVPRAKVPLTRAETKALECYKKLADEFGDTALSVESRLEYAELLAERDGHAEVVKLLKDALDKEPTDRPVANETMEKIRLRLGGSQFVGKQFADAAKQFDAVAGNEKSMFRAQASYRAGESHAAAGDFAKASERLLPFRDKGEWQNLGGVSDRAVLRLGHAQLGAGKADDAKATFEAFLNRYQNNPFAPDARYGLGLVHQAKGNHDEAVKAFEAVIAATQTETAAKAQLQVGQCHLARKKYGDAASAFLLVQYTYDYPELSYAAVLEAARALDEDGKPADADKLLNKLMKDTPADSPWHKAAKERLDKRKR